ncbi:hypothetical protein ACHHYP_00778 [Achlya hypogyna]|uniref:Myosin-like protein n=1 Tax=Achlya hypogyna TaxID=1202772 RepID=A0A1V9ZTS4_ACHHY|nr:hypothetical protein ACHHYP_00778 [Achlya hypogyna]
MRSLDETVRAKAATDGAVLDLSNAYLGDEGCAAVCRLLRQYPHKRVLDLRGNRIAADGVVHLAAFLKHDTLITHVNLEWNCAGVLEHGMEALGTALAMNASLTHLDLRNNSVGPDGAAFLAAGLKRNRTLQEIDLRWNDVGSIGGHALSDMLQENPTLLRLHLMGNNVSMATVELIEACLRRNMHAATASVPCADKEDALRCQEPLPQDDDPADALPAPPEEDPSLLLAVLAEKERLEVELATTKKHVRIAEDEHETSERRIQKLHADVRMLQDERDRFQVRELEALKTAEDYKSLYAEADSRRRKDADEYEIAKHKLETDLARLKETALQAELAHQRIFEQLEVERRQFAAERDYLEGAVAKAKASAQTAQLESERLQRLLLEERATAEKRAAEAREDGDAKLGLVGRRFEATQAALEDQVRALTHQAETAAREAAHAREASDALQASLLTLKLSHEKELSAHVARVEKEAQDRFERTVAAVEAQLDDVRKLRIGLERDVEAHVATIGRLRDEKARLRAEHDADRASLERTIVELRAAAQTAAEGHAAMDLDLARLQRKLESTTDRLAQLERDAAQQAQSHDARATDLQARYEAERARADDLHAQRREVEARLQTQVDGLHAALEAERQAGSRRLQAFAARVSRFVAQEAVQGEALEAPS